MSEKTKNRKEIDKMRLYNRNELPIKGFYGYYVRGNFVFSRRYIKDGKMLKGSRKDIITLIPTKVGGTHDRKSFTRAKLVWCANHGVNPSDVPYDFAFKFGDDGVVVEMFSDKVQEKKKKKKEELPKTVREDYRMMLGFASIAIRVIDGDKDAEAQAYSFLNSYRAEIVKYALGVHKLHKPHVVEL